MPFRGFRHCCTLFYRHIQHRITTVRLVTPGLARNMSSSSGANGDLLAAFSYENPETKHFLEDFHQLLVEEALVCGTSKENRVLEFTQPEELKDRLNLNVSEDPESHENLLSLSRDVIKYSVKTGHPRFYNQFYAGIDPYSLAGAWLTEATNSNLHTYEVSPVFVIIEKYMIEKICSLISYKAGDGVFGPGGSFSNIMAINVARYKAFPDFKENGMFGSQRVVLFTSEDAHYSLTKGAAFLGMGLRSVIAVKTDSLGRMMVSDLELKINEAKTKGFIPFMVSATCGTTVLGSFDNLRDISEVCRKHKLWLHSDGCWGGGVLVSDKHRHLMDGIERCDSFAWNFHKMNGTHLQCSAFVVKEKGLLEKCNGSSAEYLFQPDKQYDVSYDVGDKTVQCGRKVDVVKLWLQWKAWGNKGMAARVDRAFENAEYFTSLLRQSEGFKLVLPEFQCTNICFWYLPPRLRGQPETSEWWTDVGKVTAVIKQRMMASGSMMIGYNPMTTKGFVNFFRIIIQNPLCDFEQMEFILAEIDRLGRDL